MVNTVSRRSFVKFMGAGVAMPLAACGGGSSGGSGTSYTSNTSATATPSPSPTSTAATTSPSPSPTSTAAVSLSDRWFMPDESASHRCTWMAFGARSTVWGNSLLPAVQENLGLIARTLVEFEPVRMLVRQVDVARARNLCGSQVELIVADLDDLWMRDSGPVFVRNETGALAGVDFNFNGWGNKQAHANDAKVAARVINLANATPVRSSLVLEGGGIEVDGEGTALVTESCVLNANRNPGVSKAQCEAELKRVLGLKKIIWLPGIAGRDITDGHTDFYARFLKPGAVVAALETDVNQYDYQVTRQHLAILRNATDAQGRALDVVTLAVPSTIRPQFATAEFAPGYINYYVANGVLLLPQFGDANADAEAQLVLGESYPGREVIALNVDAIAAGGGGIHCATQQEPVRV